MKDQVDHVLRPRLPWRAPDESAVTECGLDAAKVKTLSREQFFRRLKDYGEQRTALVTCMTCTNTAKVWPAWRDDPRLALSREVTWEGPHWSWRREPSGGEYRGHRLRDELLAIEALIAAHREEYLEILSAIDARQQWLERKSRGVMTNG